MGGKLSVRCFFHLQRFDPADAAAAVHTIHKYSLADILDYVNTVPVEEISFVSEAYRVNMELFEEGLNSPRTTFARSLLEMNSGEVFSKDEKNTGSLLCNAAIAAGTGMACGICYLKGGGLKEMEYVINNMASSITGMICDGGNQGCTMKGVAACDTAFRSVEFVLKGVHIDKVHGINGATAEDTMRNMGLIASPGMVGTEKTIVEIFENKLK